MNLLRYVFPASLLALVACIPVSTGGGSALITGTVFYRERIAVPPEAEVRVSLESLSCVDSTKDRVAETVFRARGGPPYAFALGYDPSKILSGCRYGLHAGIRAGGKVLFVGEPLALDGLDGSQIAGVELLVRRASGDGEAVRPPG